MRIILAALTALVLALPAAHAQTSPRMVMTFHFDHDTMDLGEDGHAQMPVHAKLRAENFTCPQEFRVTANIALAYKDKWAGASLQPPSAKWTIHAGEPGTTGVERTAETILELHWDLDSAPDRNASQDYVLEAKDFKYDTTGSCVLNPGQVQARPSKPMRATVPDRGPVPAPVDCQAEPFHVACETTMHVPERTPAPGLVPALGAVLGGLLVRRSRRATRPKES